MQMICFMSYRVPFFLGHARVDADGWKITFNEQLVQPSRSAYTFDKYHNLIEIQCIKQVIQFTVFLQLAQFDVVLPRTIVRNDTEG